VWGRFQSSKYCIGCSTAVHCSVLPGSMRWQLL